MNILYILICKIVRDYHHRKTIISKLTLIHYHAFWKLSQVSKTNKVNIILFCSRKKYDF